MSSHTLAAPPRTVAPASLVRGFGICLLSLVVLVPVVIAVRAGAYESFADNALSGFGMWGTFAIHMWTRPRRKEWVATVLLGLAMRAAYDFAIGERGYVGSVIIGMGTFLGLASLLVMAVGSLGAATERRAICRRSLGMLALFSYIGICLGFYLPFARLMLPRKFDYFLYHFDGSLGLQPSFVLGRIFDRFRPVFWTELMIYNGFGFWFAVLYAVHANARQKFPVNLVKMIVANAFIGFSLYFLCPAMGPKYAFPTFPQVPSAAPTGAAWMSGVPNAMPSLHFAGTLLIFWFSRPWKWLYRVMGVWTVLTAVATMGLGEHYLIDLVVAVPYSLAILALSAGVPERKLPLCAASAMVLAWLVVLRFASFHPAVSWLLVVATIAVCFALQQRLAQRVWIPLPATPDSR